MPAAFEELVGSPRVSIQDGKFSAVRKFKINWADSIEFFQDLVGYWSASAGSFSYVPPAPFPGVPEAVCRGFELEPFPEDYIATGASANLWDNTNQPLYGMVTATYTIEQSTNGKQQRNTADEDLPAQPDGTFISWNEETGADILTIPGRSFKWQPNNKPAPPELVPGILIPTRQLSVQWSRVPAKLIPRATIDAARGKINTAKFFSHSAGTVLFLGARISEEHQFSGDVVATVSYSFSVKEIKGTAGSGIYGWNYGYNPEAVANEHWQQLIALDNGQSAYQSYNLKNLFKFDGT